MATAPDSAAFWTCSGLMRPSTSTLVMTVVMVAPHSAMTCSRRAAKEDETSGVRSVDARRTHMRVCVCVRARTCATACGHACGRGLGQGHMSSNTVRELVVHAQGPQVCAHVRTHAMVQCARKRACMAARARAHSRC